MQVHLRLLTTLAAAAGAFYLLAQPAEPPVVEPPPDGQPQPVIEQPVEPAPVLDQPAIEPPPAVIPQPAAPAAPATNAPFAERQRELRRRFQARTNEIAGTNPPAAATFPSFPAPALTPRQRMALSNAAAGGTNAIVGPAAATNATVAGPAVRTVPSRAARTNVVTAADVMLPAPGAVERTANPIPAPPGGGTNVFGQVASGTNTLAGLEPSSNPIASNLSPDEVIPAGAISVQMPLDQFLDVYSLYSGRTVLRPVTLPAPQVLILKAATDLTRREVVEAMDGVLALNNITMIPMGDKFVKAVPSNLAGQEGAEITRARGEELPLAEQFVTMVVKLKTAKPTEVAPTLQSLAKAPTAVTPIDSNQTIILRDYSSNVKRMLEIIEKIDVMPESDFTLEVIPIKYGKVGDIYATMSALISGSGGAGGAATAGGAGTMGAAGRGGMMGGGMMGGGRTGMMGGGGYGSRMGGSRMGGGMYGGGGGSYGSQYGGGGYGGSYSPYELEQEGVVTPQQVAPQPAPGAAQGSFQQRLNQIVNRAAGGQEPVKILENANIVPDERSNKLLIFANKRDMAMITNIVSKVDVMLAQVLLEAIIMEVTWNNGMEMGVTMVQHPKQFGQDFAGGGTSRNPIRDVSTDLTGLLTNAVEGFTYVGTIAGDFDVAVNAIATDNKVNVLSRPRIQTSHAIPGSFFSGQTRPYVSGVTDYGVVGGSINTRSTITQQEIGISLDVVPFITPEGMVVMEIFQNTQSHPDDVIIDGNPIPVIGTRMASSVLTVRDGDIIMLGGFIQVDSRDAKSGVPFLKDIPGLGFLFRSRTQSKIRSEVIVLMKATVLETPEQAAFLADTERRQLPGVREAEREFQELEAKEMKKVQKKEKKK